MQYKKKEIDRYWGSVKNVTQAIPNNIIKIRRTDSDRGIARSSYNTDSVGEWALRKEIAPGNG